MYYVHNLHETYGPYVRLTPTEVSTSDPNSFSQIHRIGSGFLKSQWYLDMVILPRPAVFTMKDPKDHARRRKLLARAFSKSELRQHCEAIVMEKVKLAVSKMRDEASAGVADALKWWTLMATDVSVHLMFGESFHMIEKGRVRDAYESWRLIYLALIISCRRTYTSRRCRVRCKVEALATSSLCYE